MNTSSECLNFEDPARRIEERDYLSYDRGPMWLNRAASLPLADTWPVTESYARDRGGVGANVQWTRHGNGKWYCPHSSAIKANAKLSVSMLSKCSCVHPRALRRPDVRGAE